MSSKDPKQTFNREEISKIIAKASRVQAQKKLQQGADSLDIDELVTVAQEVGIDQDSLQIALDSLEEHDLETRFDWLKGTSKIQHIAYIDGVINDDNFHEIAQEIRTLTGGLGEMTKTGNAYEWTQVVNEIGNRHISFSPQNDRIRIQGISTWPGFKFLVNLFSGIIPFMVTAIFAVDAELNPFVIVLLASLAAVGGISLGRFALKSYFENQKKSLLQIIDKVSRRINKVETPLITIEEEHERDTTSGAHDPSSKVKG